MPGTWSRIKNWITGDTLTAADLNAEFNNVINNATPAGTDDYSINTAQMQTTRDPYPAAVESLAVSLAEELAALRYLTAQITGKAQWYIDPDKSIADLYAGIVNVRTVTSTPTVAATDCVLRCDAQSAGFNVTLPTAVNIPGKIYIIKKINANANSPTVTTTASQTIDGVSTFILSLINDYIAVQSDNTNWNIIGGIIKSPTITTPTITTPTIADLTNMNHTHISAAQGGLLSISGVLNGIQYLTSGTTYTPTSGTASIVIEVVAGGGGGGGGNNAINTTSGGGGGGAGGYALKRFTGISGTYTYAIGSGGTGNSGGTPGGTGGNTTFTGPGPVTVTAFGGIGAASATTGSIGALGGAVSTNGDVNSGGAPGTSQVPNISSGTGGSTQFGSGGGCRAVGGHFDGLAALGYGAGGGGAVGDNLDTPSFAYGGAGKQGIIVVYEYK